MKNPEDFATDVVIGMSALAFLGLFVLAAYTFVKGERNG